jgi:16S rRNA (adenine1518-N6/adenine1519-N6)-dimethyltransferase
LLAASIDPARPGETLTIDEFVRLYQRSAEAGGDSAISAARTTSQRHASAS